METIKLHSFTFNRKRGGGKYTALQFAVPVSRKTRKGEVVTKPDISEFIRLDAATIRKYAQAHELNEHVAMILGFNILLRRKAAGSGMVDVVIAKLRDMNILSNETDVQKRELGLRMLAANILQLFRERQRIGKPLTLDACFSKVLD